MLQSTIAAIATPMATGGISIIRISGENAIAISDKIFKAENSRLLSSKKGYTASFGAVYSGDIRLDTSIATVFKAPKSYTGEDVVELSCHGGVYITQEILGVVLDAGARLSQPGEFTKRAFLNGKLSLTQAEAVIDVINSKNSQALRAANAQLDGALYKKIQEIKNELLQIAGHLAAWVDYPEEDIEVIAQDVLLDSLNRCLEALRKLLDTFDYGQIIKEGIDTVIVGKPNVGKSTLMNLLSGCKKSIVTDIAGTTRDVVEGTVIIGDIMLRLSDTAGIRDTEDKVEKFGVDLAKERLKNAALVLAVFDSSSPLEDPDFRIVESINKQSTIAIINKTDLGSNLDAEWINSNFEHVISISAKEEISLSILENVIKEVVKLNDFDLSGGIIATQRQRGFAIEAKLAIEEGITALNCGMTLDAVTVSVESAIQSLLELTGGRVTEDVVNQVFSHFCVGK